MSGLDLYLSQGTLALLLVYGALTGFGLGALYDGFRVLRMILGDTVSASNPHSSCADGKPKPSWRLLLFAEDVIFMIAASVALILLCYYANDGQLRAPAVVGMCGGFFVYRHTVSRLLLRLAEALICPVKRVLLTLGRLAIAPLCGLWSVTVGQWLYRYRQRKSEKRIRALTEQAARGFDLTKNPPHGSE